MLASFQLLERAGGLWPHYESSHPFFGSDHWFCQFNFKFDFGGLIHNFHYRLVYSYNKTPVLKKYKLMHFHQPPLNIENKHSMLKGSLPKKCRIRRYTPSPSNKYTTNILAAHLNTSRATEKYLTILELAYIDR